ncbi:tetratricopeptide repeat protein [Psychroserpens sp. SPM9]|uniref:tetratricopeptide repeat protein n=1 Tax=Psychroserpens sp. SPM9 TaxID=2975598 RepID=UPI0021A74574|nr:tetratricopeptide repeat protein [Psychroserpens sp. SPM9]MDG5490718.1 tetratricopeptide repeat protein [Psychroserpens sp. SPM9]
MLKYIRLIILLISSLSYCQSPVDKLIDSLNLTDSPKKKIVLSQQIAFQLKDTDWERAITYLELAESEAKKSENPNLHLAPIYFTIGQMYSSKDVLDVTLDYYQKAYNIYNETNNSEEASKTENNLSIIYARLNDKEKALKHFKNVYNYQVKENDSLRLAQILNNIGTLYLETNVDSSLLYYQKAFEISKTLGNTSLSAYVYTNLARSYTSKNDSINAAYFLNKAISIANVVETPTKAFVYQSVSEYYLNRQENDSAIVYAKKTINLLKDNYYSFSNKNAVNTLYKAYINKENYKDAAEYFEVFNTIRDSLNIEEKAVNVERLKLQQEYRTRAQIEALKAEKKQFKYILIGLSLIASILLLLILLIKYKNRITNNRLEKELLETKQKELSYSLDAKNKVLIGKAMTEMHRTDIINSILTDLKQIKLKAVKKETQQAIDFILKRLQRDLNTDIWQEFEVSFEQVHKSFYKNLTQNHPDLTPKDRRLCALLFLDLTSKEISQITGQSFKAVENARTRLRKKLNLTNEKVNLSTYLNSLSLN